MDPGSIKQATLTIEFNPVIIEVRQAISAAINTAASLVDRLSGPVTVEFMFKEVLIRINADSNPELIFRDYMLNHHKKVFDSHVGPYPDPIRSLSDAAAAKAALTVRRMEAPPRDAATKVRYIAEIGRRNS